jgi:hypothetical protein
MLLESKRGSYSAVELSQEVELLLTLYDKRNALAGSSSASRGITQWSFIEMMTPQLQLDSQSSEPAQSPKKTE